MTIDNLYDPKRGGEAIRLERLRIGRKPFDPGRTNYFTVYLIETASSS